jgi:hypothetical protein
MFEPTKENLKIYQGATFRKTWEVLVDGQIIDMTGWSGRMQVRYEYDDVEPAISLTSADDEVILDVDNSRVTIYIPPAKTALIAADGVYDVELVDAAGDVGRLLMGKIKLYPEVTK